jgi:hypothetical protein
MGVDIHVALDIREVAQRQLHPSFQLSQLVLQNDRSTIQGRVARDLTVRRAEDQAQHTMLELAHQLLLRILQLLPQRQLDQSDQEMLRYQAPLLDVLENIGPRSCLS